MSRFAKDDYAYLKRLLVTITDRATLSENLFNNRDIILAALDIAAADPAPRTAEPEADGDRTVHPAMDRVPATELLRRVTELEKLANATAMFALSTSQTSRSRELLDQARNAWLKSRAGEWV